MTPTLPGATEPKTPEEVRERVLRYFFGTAEGQRQLERLVVKYFLLRHRVGWLRFKAFVREKEHAII